MLDILQRKQGKVVEDPKFITMLFSDARFSVLWLLVRVWLGWTWLQPAWGKINNPKWTETGEALLGFWQGAVAVGDDGKGKIVYDWYRTFLQFMIDTQSHVWFAKLIAYGEFFVGIGLIVGAFVGFAAFFGAFMNFNFMLAGSASSNPVLFIVALLLVFAWKTAGFIGADYFLLPLLGTPWGRGQTAEEDGLKKVHATS